MRQASKILSEMSLTLSGILEKATPDATEKYHLYVFVVNNGGIISDTIRAVTGDKYTHVSVSVSPVLDPLYSFAVKIGFLKEDLEKHYKPTSPCAVYKTELTKSELKRVKQTLAWFKKNRDKTSYNYLGLGLAALNVDFLADAGDRATMLICSQFVRLLFINAGIGDRLGDSGVIGNRIKPMDFSDAPGLRLAWRGTVGGLVKKFKSGWTLEG